jgi:hypothetical protein
VVLRGREEREGGAPGRKNQGRGKAKGARWGRGVGGGVIKEG